MLYVGNINELKQIEISEDVRNLLQEVYEEVE